MVEFRSRHRSDQHRAAHGSLEQEQVAGAALWDELFLRKHVRFPRFVWVSSRHAIFETFAVSDVVRQLVSPGDALSYVRSLEKELGFLTEEREAELQVLRLVRLQDCLKQIEIQSGNWKLVVFRFEEFEFLFF